MSNPVGRRGWIGATAVLMVVVAVDPARAAEGAKAASTASVPLPDAKPVPRMQVLPLPYGQASITRDGKELTRLHYGAGLHRPFLYPVIGPAGRSLTRMGHPHDPVTHSHHNSFWVAHHDVDGEGFWADSHPGRIVPQRILRFGDGDSEAEVVLESKWVGKGGVVHLVERRRVAVRPMAGGEWLILLDLHLTAPKGKKTTLNKTPFGLVGVRMAKTIGVHDGGGLIRNSEGQIGEQGPTGCFRKPARWVDYSGPIAPNTIEGLTLLDHPANVSHPTPFHVRGDGWMGASLTYAKALRVTDTAPLRLRYGLYVHRGAPTLEALQAIWKTFAQTKPADLTNVKR